MRSFASSEAAIAMEVTRDSDSACACLCHVAQVGATGGSKVCGVVLGVWALGDLGFFSFGC